MYGSSTVLVYTTGHGVHGFTFEPDVGEFLLSYRDIRTPDHGRIYSVNEGNYASWSDALKRYIDWMKEKTRLRGALIPRATSARWSPTSTATCLRRALSLSRDARSPLGKLRLLYEAAPLAFVAEQAGGAASDGRCRIMDLAPEILHQRTPLFIGSKQNIADCVNFLNGKHPALKRDAGRAGGGAVGASGARRLVAPTTPSLAAIAAPSWLGRSLGGAAGARR